LTLQQKVHLLSKVILPDTQKEVEKLTQLLHETQAENEELQQQFALERVQVQSKYDALEKQLADALGAKKELEQSRKDLRKLKSQKAEMQQLIKKKQKDSKTYKAKCKGIYTPEMHSLAFFFW
jgi:chromosome segregation ATPase